MGEKPTPNPKPEKPKPADTRTEPDPLPSLFETDGVGVYIELFFVNHQLLPIWCWPGSLKKNILAPTDRELTRRRGKMEGATRAQVLVQKEQLPCMTQALS